MPLAERIHQFFKNALSAFVRRDQRDWDSLLPILLTVYNDAIHDSLGGYSPSQVFLGRTIGIPIHDLESLQDLNPKYYVDRLRLTLDRVQRDVTKRSYELQMRNLLRRDGTDFVPFKVDDKVAISVESLPAGIHSAKLYPRWKGPYRISKVSRDSKVVYLVDAAGVDFGTPVSVLRVKIWHDNLESDTDISIPTDAPEMVDDTIFPQEPIDLSSDDQSKDDNDPPPDCFIHIEPVAKTVKRMFIRTPKTLRSGRVIGEESIYIISQLDSHTCLL